MNYSNIKWNDIANGEGVRISLFVSGCAHHCKNCFNQVAWDFKAGKIFDNAIQDEVLQHLKNSYISGISLLGGEPLEPQNQQGLLPFVQQVKQIYPDKTIWCYTGYTLDGTTGVLLERQKNTPHTKSLISLFDVLVDGAFIEELKDIRLKFRGSANQRIIDVQKTLPAKKCVLYLE